MKFMSAEDREGAAEEAVRLEQIWDEAPVGPKAYWNIIKKSKENNVSIF